MGGRTGARARKRSLAWFRDSGDGFAPDDLGGLVLWLDADDASTLFQDAAMTIPASNDGDVVGGWQDKSGNGHHAIQATTSQKPTLKKAIENGLDVVRFDITDDVLEFNLADSIKTQFEWFLVANITDTGGGSSWPFWTGQNAYDSGTGDHAIGLKFDWVVPDSWGPMCSFVGNRNLWLRQHEHEDGLHIWGSRAVADSYLDGSHDLVELTQAVASGAFRYEVTPGTRGFYGVYGAGDVLEVIIYDTALSADNRTFARTYLSNKWGLGLF